MTAAVALPPTSADPTPAIGAAAPAPEVRVVRDLAYGPHPVRHLLDLHLPQEGPDPRPLIIWIHGGGWQKGGKDRPSPIQTALEAGYAVACINYRYSSEAVFPAQILDCQRAIRWLRAHADGHGLDPAHFGVWGESAGGHLAALVGIASDDFPADDDPLSSVSAAVQAVCSYFGPTDLLAMDRQSRPGSKIVHDHPSSPESQLIGGPIQEHRQLAERANPIRYITPAAPPFFIVHGLDDPLVPPGQSEMLHAALQARGVESQLFLLPGAAHGGSAFKRLAPLHELVAFFDRHLRPAR